MSPSPSAAEAPLLAVLLLLVAAACGGHPTSVPPRAAARPAVVHADAAQRARHARIEAASRSATRPALTDPSPSPTAADEPPTVQVLELMWCESLRDNSWTTWADSRARGFFQFEPETWTSVGGTGDPAAASIAEQYHRLVLLWRRDGGSFREWECARIVGLP